MAGRVRSLALGGALLLLPVAAPARGETGTFALSGRVCAMGCAAGRCISKCARLASTLRFAGDGTYRTPSGTCALGAVTVPDEVGSVIPGKRGSLVLLPSNLEDLQQAVFDCLSQQYDVTLVRIRRYRTRVRITADDQGLRGVHHDHARVRIQGHTVDVFDVARFRGTRTAGSASGALLDVLEDGVRAALPDP